MTTLKKRKTAEIKENLMKKSRIIRKSDETIFSIRALGEHKSEIYKDHFRYFSCSRRKYFKPSAGNEFLVNSFLPSKAI